ncbi:Baseplate assembly protein J [Stappia sp. 22II-S9-Z10]|nr:Baseplate assembly protein J [Stappia sp. 22II-S9-Z10]
MAQRFYDIDFANLTPPDAIAPLDFEVIYEARKARFLELWEDARLLNPDLPDYDTLVLNTDPVAIILQENAYREVVLRQLVNDRYLLSVLPFSFGDGLDVLGAHYSVTRETGETDDRFRRRIQLAHEAQSTCGPAGAYVFHALAAEPALTDAFVRSPRPGHVEITCRVAGADPRPTSAQLQAVLAYISAEGRKPLTDTVSVRAPSITRSTIVATLTVPAGAARASMMATARARLDAVLAKNLAGMDAPLYRSAIISALHAEGVQSVNLIEPAADLLPPADEVGLVVIDGITLAAAGTV